MLSSLSSVNAEIEQGPSATMIDALSSLSMRVTATQAGHLLSVASVLANRTVSFTQEMGDVLLQATTEALAGIISDYMKRLWAYGLLTGLTRVRPLEFHRCYIMMITC
jgi:hypothetical protein